MAQNEMKAMRGMPLRVRSMEGLERILVAVNDMSEAKLWLGKRSEEERRPNLCFAEL